SAPRGRDSCRVARHADPERTRQGNEAQWWREQKRLTVQADGHGFARAYLELERRPLPYAAEATLLSNRPECDHLRDRRGAAQTGGEDSEPSGVKVGPRARAAKATELVRIVGDDHE